MRAWCTRTLSGRLILACVFAVWFAGTAWGMKVLLDYQVAPGVAAFAPKAWPASSSLPRPALSPTLVLVLHPRCPCSRATLTELAQIVAHTRGRLAVEVLFVVPPGLDGQWAMASLWRQASAIPGVHLTLDSDGLEARHFGAATSGQALFYDTSGRLRFAGGITPGRGHEGDNAGEAAVEALASATHTNTNKEALAASSPVFGCALASPSKSSLVPGPTCTR